MTYMTYRRSVELPFETLWRHPVGRSHLCQRLCHLGRWLPRSQAEVGHDGGQVVGVVVADEDVLEGKYG